MLEKDLSAEVAAYLRERSVLQAQHGAGWVVFAGEKFQGAFDGYEQAARFAILNFRGSSFLVRNLVVDEEQVPLIFADAE